MGKFFTPDDIDPSVQYFLRNLIETPLNVFTEQPAMYERVSDVVTFNYDNRESLAEGLRILKRDTATAKKRAECGTYMIREIEKFLNIKKDKPDSVTIERKELESLIATIVDDRITLLHRLAAKS